MAEKCTADPEENFLALSTVLTFASGRNTLLELATLISML